jgi:hypothetical protein
MARTQAMLEESWRRGEPFDPTRRTLLLAGCREQTRKVMELITRCNEPQVLPQEVVESLEELTGLSFDSWDGSVSPILEPGDISSLRIAKGSLSAEEREQINKHVTHTYDFLRQIPWTPALAGLPDIAYAHHERLNGKGYPRGLMSAEIPVQSKLMAVPDVYDALAASDRPYKEAVTHARSLEILEAEARAGLLDEAALKIFIESGTCELTRDLMKEGARV